MKLDTPVLKDLSLRKNSLIRRIAIRIVLISSCLTLVATSVQLYIGLHWDIAAVDERLKQVAQSYLDSLANSLWTFDDDQTTSILIGIVTLPEIQRAEVLTSSQQTFEQGSAPPPNYSLVQEYPIVYRGTEDLPGLEHAKVGTLRLTANLKQVYLRLIDKFLVILGTNLAKVVPFSILIFLIFRTLVTRHLDTISSYMLRMNLNHLHEELALERAPSTKGPDELDVLTQSINRMRLSLAEKVVALKAANLERAHLIEQLQASLKARDEFLSIASHELRTPLTSLSIHYRLIQKILSQLKLDHVPGSSRVFSSFDIYEEQLTRLMTLAENLLDISQIQSDAFEIHLQDNVELGSIVTKVIERFRPSLDKAGCQLDLETENKELRMRADPDRVAQAIGNLLSNAAKYGFGKPVKVRVSREGNFGQVMVRDQGVGINQEDQKRIFGQFERAVSYKNFGGFGLGLFIANEIVSRHGGHISVESKPGAGAAFSIQFPLLDEKGIS